MAIEDDKAKFQGRKFPDSVNFFKNPAQRDQAISNVSAALNLQPTSWNQVRGEIVPFLLSAPGIMKSLVESNPPLNHVVGNFLTGESRITLVGGVPGNGKSLLVTGLRQYHEIFSGLDESLQHPLAVVPWDKVHDAYFDALTNKVDSELKPPKGETDPLIRDEVSHTMLDVVMLLHRHTPAARILIEAPLFGARGRVIQEAFERYHLPGQTVVMHSPQMQREILTRGVRDVATSGQPEAIEAIEARILEKMIGELRLRGTKRREEVVENYWKISVGERGGVVVNWDPNIDRPGFELTRAQYKENATRPDDYSPEPLGKLVTSIVNARLDLMSEEKFLELVKRAKNS